MKISTRLALIGVISVAVVTGMGVILLSSTETVRRELAKNEASDEMLNGILTVRHLMQEYVQHHEERARVQWRLRSGSLASLLVTPSNADASEQETFIRLRQANAIVQALFSEMVTANQTSDMAVRQSAVHRDMEERLTGQVVIRTEAMISDASSLARQSRIGVMNAQRRQGVAVLAFGCFMLAILSAIIWVAIRSVLRPLAMLRAGAAIVGAGNIDFRLDESSRDELGDLARAFNDMTEKLKGRDANIRHLVDSNIIGIVISGLDGKVVEANDAFLDLLGYDRLDLQSGRVDWKDISPPESRSADALALRQLRESGTYAPFEKECLHRNGHRIPVVIGGALLEGSPTCSVGFVLDLTERKFAQEVLARTQADLTHLARVTSLGALTASIAHEVSQPLSGIITNASTCLRMLAAEPPNIDGARETARRMLRDGNRASEVISRLRALFSKRAVTTEPVDLNDAVLEVLTLSRSELVRDRVLIRLELADHLPFVTGDRVQFQQVILNLLLNAAEAMSGVDDRPKLLMIRTDRDESDDCARVSVQDVGVGFEPSNMDKLFEPFYSTKSSGMGIGLSVSRSIIENHRGRLWATPNAGAGATFSFSVPLGPEHARARAPLESDQPKVNI